MTGMNEDAASDEAAKDIIVEIYLSLDASWGLLLQWRMHGREMLYEAVANHLQDNMLHRFKDPKPERFQLKKAARVLVDRYVDLRKIKYPWRERFWRIASWLLGWPKELPEGARAFR